MTVWYSKQINARRRDGGGDVSSFHAENFPTSEQTIRFQVVFPLLSDAFRFGAVTASVCDL